MILKYMGHSFFTIATANGSVIALDPYGDFYQYPKRSIQAQVVTISHHHHDHDGMGSITGHPVVVDKTGTCQPLDDVAIKGIPTKHDNKNGTQRGENTFFVLNVDGLRIGHAGDLGHKLDQKTAKEIGKLDVLMIPVGGYYTIDANTALETALLLSPRIVIPMHYRTRYDSDMPIAPVEDFLSLTNNKFESMPLLRITKEDVSERSGVCVLDIA